MLSLRKGRYITRLAETPADVLAAQELRTLTFRGPGSALDRDPFDEICKHMLVEDARSGELVCCFRLLPLSGGAEIGQSYSAQYYELSGLADFTGPMVEMGRFCIHPDHRDPDILRVAWGAMTQYVDDTGTEMLFGCSSFKGTEADAYMDAFA
ncbi:GNAT family N-acetyltransferase, partial [Escherichia coli]|nr:GNAT family N-acetyltransferase [Escherichia coli]